MVSKVTTLASCGCLVLQRNLNLDGRATDALKGKLERPVGFIGDHRKFQPSLDRAWPCARIRRFEPYNSVESMPPRKAEDVFDFASDMFVRNGLPSPVPAILADEDLTRGIKHCWNALWEVEGARDDLTALDVPVWLICGDEDEFFPGAEKLAADTGLPLLTLSGDHASATPALYERLDELIDYWRTAESR